MPTIFEFNLPGIPQVHMRIQVCTSDDVEVSLRNEDRPADQATLAVVRARLADCYFSHDRHQPRLDHLWVGNATFLVPVHEAELLRTQLQIRMLQDVALS